MKQLTEEQLKALYKLVEQYQVVEPWDSGDFDDFYEYGIKSGRNHTLGELKAILEG